SSFVDLKLAQLPHAGEPSVSPHDQRSADLPPSPIVSLEPNSPNGSLLFHERKYVRAHLHVKVRERRRLLPNEVEKVHLGDQRDVRETSVETTEVGNLDLLVPQLQAQRAHLSVRSLQELVCPSQLRA